MVKQINKYELKDTYSAVIKRLNLKKDVVLSTANHIVKLTEQINRTNFDQSIMLVKQDMNTIIEGLSELKPPC
jgi:hypothetical protein